MRLGLLVGSGEFWAALRTDIAEARRSVLIQTLSFEGDPAGLALAAAVRDCAAPDRRIVVDHFTRWIQNDRFLWAPANLMDLELRAEVQATTRMVADLEAAGVPVRFVSPFGPLLLRAAARNHKKLIVVDDRVVYLGGINFSEHNFSWHDMMLRVEDPAVADFCRQDFERTWTGRDAPASARFAGLELLMMDARTNESLFAGVRAALAGARDEIVVHSPYLSFPFTEWLAAAARRGVRVQVLTPEGNNRDFLKRYICWEAGRCGFDVRLVPGMSHLKGMLIDGETLVMGSSNFDYLSYRAHHEVVALVRERELVEDFRIRVLEADLARSTRHDGSVPDPWGRARLLQMRMGAWVMASLAGL